MTSPIVASRPATSGASTPAGVLPVGFAGLGTALPDEVVTNADLADTMATSDAWIRSRTGIEERRRAAPGEATSDLAATAAVAALDDAGLSATDVDAVVVATTTPDHVMPQTAPLVAARLGIDVAAFDVGAACSGFVTGLATAAGLAVSGIAETVLLVGADVFSRFLNPEDRATSVLFGDGAGAVVLRAGAGTLGPFDLGSDGNLAEILWIPAGGARMPATAETVANKGHALAMHGREVYRQAVARMTESSRAVLDAAGVSAGDLDLLVGHQANARILDAVAGRLGVDASRCMRTVAAHGNTSAASIPLALAVARDEGRLPAGAQVLLTAFGSGLTWASCLMTYDPQRTTS